MAPSWPATPRRRRARRCRRPGKLLAEAAAAGAADDARQDGGPPSATPRALARRAERQQRLAAARDRLAAEDQARRDAQRAKVQTWDAAAATGKRRGRRPADEPSRANRAGTEPRANTTDPDVQVMRNQKGYVAGYNGQLVVTGGQVIVGAMLSQYGHRGRRLLVRQDSQRPAYLVRRQVPQHSPTDLLNNRLQHEPILRDRRLRPAIEPRLQPVLDSLPDRVASRSADARGDVLPQLAELVAHLGLGPAANRTAATLTVAGVAKRDRTDPITIDSLKVDTVVTVTPAHTRHTEEPNSLALGLALF
jgi:hypothetical protein